MSRIEKKFKELNGKKAFISYIIPGIPTLSQTKELILALEKGGTDIIEVGIPYSDPIADAPIIQEVAQKALANGANIEKVFEIMADIRKYTNIPLVFSVYFNSIYAVGVEKFIDNCVKIGVDGLIIPDLSIEERGEILPFIKNKDIDLIPIIAPNSKNRIPKILENGSGFIYCIPSSTEEENYSYLKNIKEQTKLPIVSGFNVSESGEIKSFEKLYDGVIIDSALIEIINKTSGNLEALEYKVNNLQKTLERF